jgi:hypothetical protein
MKLATLNDGTRDGALLVVSADLTRAVAARPRHQLEPVLPLFTTNMRRLRMTERSRIAPSELSPRDESSNQMSKSR